VEFFKKHLERPEASVLKVWGGGNRGRGTFDGEKGIREKGGTVNGRAEPVTEIPKKNNKGIIERSGVNRWGRPEYYSAKVGPGLYPDRDNYKGIRLWFRNAARKERRFRTPRRTIAKGNFLPIEKKRKKGRRKKKIRGRAL